MKNPIIKIIIVVLIIIGIAQLIGYWEIQFFENKIKHEGIGNYGSVLAFVIVLPLSFFVIGKTLPKEWKEKHDVLCDFLRFAFSITLAFTLSSHVKNKLEETQTDAFKDYYTTIGHITQKSTSTRHNRTYYFIWAGINDTTTSRHWVEKDIYDLCYVGAPVIMKVSKQYPSVYEIINWNPKPDDIDKYQNKDK